MLKKLLTNRGFDFDFAKFMLIFGKMSFMFKH